LQESALIPVLRSSGHKVDGDLIGRWLAKAKRLLFSTIAGRGSVDYGTTNLERGFERKSLL
jgi:hypothetical protein